VHLVDFITKKFVTMHGHMDVKYNFTLKMLRLKHISIRYGSSSGKETINHV